VRPVYTINDFVVVRQHFDLATKIRLMCQKERMCTLVDQSHMLMQIKKGSLKSERALELFFIKSLKL
jgi:hypothetical protein